MRKISKVSMNPSVVWNSQYVSTLSFGMQTANYVIKNKYGYARFPAPPSSLTVPKIEIDFDTPHRERFLRDEYPQGRGGGSGGPNRYTILGRGSYGVVIKARYKARPVAVKILEKHKKHQCRYDSLRNESNVLNLKHENIVRVLKIISGAQYGLVIMERFDGHCLQTVLNQNVEISVYHRLM